MQIKIEMGRTWKGVYRSVAISDTVQNGIDWRVALDELRKDVSLALVTLELDTVSDEKYTGSAEVTPAASDEVIKFDAERIERSVQNGKVAYRVKGASYTKWGIVCYPEVMKQAGIEVTEDGLSGSWRVTCAVRDGKPVKVIHIE